MNKTYAFTDLHGMYNLWEQIKNYCDDSDTLIFLGDACDRGEDGIKIIRELLNDPRVIYLKGNHEDMLAKVGQELLQEKTNNLQWWISNGGKETARQFLSLDPQSQQWLLQKINELPKSMSYTNAKGQDLFLSHAGCRPDLTEDEMEIMGYATDPYIWDRKHITYPWPEGEEYENLYVVHGHTPTQTLRRSLTRDSAIIATYANGHKIDLDIASFISCRVALLDLDTLKIEKYFNDDETFKETCVCD